MKQSLIIVYATLAILIVIAYFVGGSSTVMEGINISITTASNSALMLIASFIVIGQLNVLLTSEVIEKWLQKFKGLKAIIVSAIAGGLFPGGPYIYYPFISNFKEMNLPFYILISFIFGKQVYDFARFPMEVSLVSLDIAIIRTLITLPIPIVVGLLAYKFYNKGISYPIEKEGENSGPNNNNS